MLRRRCADLDRECQARFSGSESRCFGSLDISVYDAWWPRTCSLHCLRPAGQVRGCTSLHAASRAALLPRTGWTWLGNRYGPRFPATLPICAARRVRLRTLEGLASSCITLIRSAKTLWLLPAGMDPPRR
jgi:hypothetical protein